MNREKIEKELREIYNDLNPCLYNNCNSDGMLNVGNPDVGDEAADCEYCNQVRFPKRDEFVNSILSKIAESEREAYIDMAEIAVELIDCIEGDCESGDSLHVAIRTAKDEIKFALARRGIGEDGK